MSPAKQFYHCFGCGAHGSAIRFLMDYDRLEFPDAIEELAARAGVKVEYEGGGRPVQREDASDLYTLLDAAARFYHQQLANNSAARDYVASRGLSAEMVERFTIGFAPEQWDGLKSALGSNAQRLALLDKAGMLASGDRGNQGGQQRIAGRCRRQRLGSHRRGAAGAFCRNRCAQRAGRSGHLGRGSGGGCHAGDTGK